MRAFWVAVQFLTRIPVPGGHIPATQQTLRRAIVFFPFVGAGIGLITASLVHLTACVWPLWLAVFVAMAAEARLTGAFHEDAVADFFDAFGGGWNQEQVLTILKDSRIGSFGSVALMFALLVRGGAMVAIPTDTARFWAIIASATVGRLVILMAMALLAPVADRDSLARDVGAQASARAVALGTVLAAPGMLGWIAYMPGRALLTAMLIPAVLFWFLHLVKRTIGGITGDCLGCLCYLVQILLLLVAAASL